MNKEVKKLIRTARKAGWIVEWRSGGHPAFVNPRNGERVFAPATPGDHRSLKNFKRRLARAGLDTSQ